MTVIRAHFDGKVLVPDEPVDLPVDRPLEVHVHPIEPIPAPKKALMKLVELARQFPAGPGMPTDSAAQHDHYLYGLPKRP
jgi:hypothetical protein